MTCTNGEFGDAPGQVKPGDDGHDEQAVAQLRLAELRQSCKILGVTDLELLGYHDSGMPDWEYKDRPDAFCNIPLDEVAGRIGGLIERYRPQIVISYDAKGMYQHPDHVHAAPAAAAAAAQSGIPAKFYQSRHARQSTGARSGRRCARPASRCPTGGEPTEESSAADGRGRGSASPPRSTSGRCWSASGTPCIAHASQIQDSWFSKIPPEIAEEAFGRESFVRVTDTTGAPCRRTTCSPACA